MCQKLLKMSFLKVKPSQIYIDLKTKKKTKIVCAKNLSGIK